MWVNNLQKTYLKGVLLEKRLGSLPEYMDENVALFSVKIHSLWRVFIICIFSEKETS